MWCGKRADLKLIEQRPGNAEGNVRLWSSIPIYSAGPGYREASMIAIVFVRNCSVAIPDNPVQRRQDAELYSWNHCDSGGARSGWLGVSFLWTHANQRRRHSSEHRAQDSDECGGRFDGPARPED